MPRVLALIGGDPDDGCLPRCLLVTRPADLPPPPISPGHADDEAPEPDDATAAAMLEHRSEAVTLPIPAAVRSELAPSEPLCAAVDGFSLHADLVAPHNAPKTLQRLVRYGLRPPLAHKRLSWTADGKVRLKLRKPSATGRTSIVFEPVEFLLSRSRPPPALRHCRPAGSSTPTSTTPSITPARGFAPATPPRLPAWPPVRLALLRQRSPLSALPPISVQTALPAPIAARRTAWRYLAVLRKCGFIPLLWYEESRRTNPVGPCF